MAASTITQNRQELATEPHRRGTPPPGPPATRSVTRAGVGSVLWCATGVTAGALTTTLVGAARHSESITAVHYSLLALITGAFTAAALHLALLWALVALVKASPRDSLRHRASHTLLRVVSPKMARALTIGVGAATTAATLSLGPTTAQAPIHSETTVSQQASIEDSAAKESSTDEANAAAREMDAANDPLRWVSTDPIDTAEKPEQESATKEPEQAHAAGEIPVDEGPRTYTVKEGDTIWGLVATHLGPGATNAQILEGVKLTIALNDHLENANLIHPGETLTLAPAYPATR